MRMDDSRDTKRPTERWPKRKFPVGIVCGPGGREPARISQIAMARNAATPRQGGARLHDQRYAN